MNALTDPWIPTPVGLLSLIEGFEKAGQFSDVEDVPPIVRLCILRLMLWIRHQAKDPIQWLKEHTESL